MALINEHPNATVRGLYAGEVAARLSLPVNDLVAAAKRGGGRPFTVNVPTERRRSTETREFIAISLLVQRWDEIAPWLVDGLFAEDTALRVFRALAAASGHLEQALAACDPEARDLLERAAVVDVDEIDVDAEARLLLGAAVRRELARRVHVQDPEEIRVDVNIRRLVEELTLPGADSAIADQLLIWLDQRVNAESSGGEDG